MTLGEPILDLCDTTLLQGESVQDGQVYGMKWYRGSVHVLVIISVSFCLVVLRRVQDAVCVVVGRILQTWVYFRSRQLLNYIISVTRNEFLVGQKFSYATLERPVIPYRLLYCS